MRRAGLATLVAALLLVVAPASTVSAVECAPNDDLCNQLNSAKAQQGDLQAQLNELQGRISATQANIAALEAVIQQLGAQRARQQAQIDATRAQVEETNRQIRLKEAEIARQEADLEVRQQILDQRVRAADKHGQLNYLELIVTSTDFNHLVDRLVIMQDLVRGDQRLLDQMQAEKAHLQQLRGQLVDQQQQQQALLAQQQQQQAALDVTIGQQQKAIAIQKQYEAQFEAQRLQLEAQKRQIDAQVDVLQQQYDLAAQRLGGGSGQFIWPEGGRYMITQGFGCTDLMGEPYDASCPTRHTHTGIDIGGPYGTPIYAADAGIATTYSSGYGYGNYIIITHGKGYTTLYGHMSGFKVGSGSPVVRGQVIGYEGSTGYSTGPHLHFEIRYNNVPQNPCAYVC